MKRKGIFTLQMITVILQAAALLITLGFTAMQSLVKTFFSMESRVLEEFSVPVNYLLKILPLLLVYVLGWLLLNKTSGKMRKTVTVIFVACAVFLQIMLGYVGVITSRFIGMRGAVALASHAVLEQAISLIANPLTWIAFALFCFSCGGYMVVEEQE